MTGFPFASPNAGGWCTARNDRQETIRTIKGTTLLADKIWPSWSMCTFGAIYTFTHRAVVQPPLVIWLSLCTNDLVCEITFKRAQREKRLFGLRYITLQTFLIQDDTELSIVKLQYYVTVSKSPLLMMYHESVVYANCMHFPRGWNVTSSRIQGFFCLGTQTSFPLTGNKFRENKTRHTRMNAIMITSSHHSNPLAFPLW